jgi:hypothetical protein
MRTCAQDAVTDLVGDLNHLFGFSFNVASRLTYRSTDIGDDFDGALQQLVLEPFTVELLQHLGSGGIGRKGSRFVHNLNLDLYAESGTLRSIEDEIHEGTLAAAP